MPAATPTPTAPRGDRVVTSVVVAAGAIYATTLTVVTWLRYEAFLPESDLAVFAQFTWLLGRFDSPFSSITLRPMLADHWEPGIALLAPLGTVGIGTVGILVVQAIALGGTAAALLAVARAFGASGWIAAVVPLLWVVSPAVVRANLWDFHPDALIALLLVLTVLGVVTDRTWLAIVAVTMALGLKEDAGLTFGALGLALAWNGRRGVGAALVGVSAVHAVLLNAVVMPGLWPATRAHYTERFVGDRGEGFADVLRFWLDNPVETVTDALSRSNLEILALLVAMTGGLCLLAARWLIVAAPSVGLNLLSAYEGQHTLDYQYWLVPATAVALAGAVGAGRARATWSRPVGGLAVASGIVLAALSLAAIVQVVRDTRDEWSRRSDRRAIVDAVPRDASVSAPLRFLSHLAERHDLYTFPLPFQSEAPESEWTPAQIARARVELDYVVFDPTLTRNPEYEAEMQRLGFVPILRRGTTILYRSSEVAP